MSTVYSVSDLNRRVRGLLLERFEDVTVNGELSDLRRIASSGHWYFTLKDRDSEIRCAMFRGDNRLVREALQDGDAVQVRARVELYLPRGMYQLVVSEMALQGQGALLQRLERRKAALQAEGLFDAERKRPIPGHPERIGIVTSPAAAALRDVLRVLHRRWPVAEAFLYPSAVQGAEAPAALAAALSRAGRDARCDILLLVRGGGSLEDLLPFSEEAVVRAVADCPIPVVTGIGHETDTMLADLAADLRGATPTAAAELATPDGALLRRRSAQLQERLARSLRRELQRRTLEVSTRVARLQHAHPRNRIQLRQQRLDELMQALLRQVRERTRSRSQRLALLRQQLQAHSPARRIDAGRLRVEHARRRLPQTMAARHRACGAQLDRLEATLRAVSPQGTLNRGYAIAQLRTGTPPRILRDAKDARPGDLLDVRLRSGSLEARVTATEEAD